MSKEATKKFVENNGFICNKCGKVIVDGHKHKNEEDLCDQCKISDLEAKLAESENKLNKYPYKNHVIEKQYENLKEGIKFRIENNITDDWEQLYHCIDVLCEKHKARIRDIENGICKIEELEKLLNAKEKMKTQSLKGFEKLKQQLAEKEKEILALKQENERNKAEAESQHQSFISCFKDKMGLTLYCDNIEKEHNQDKISFALEQLEKVKENISSGLAFDIDVQMWFEEYIDNQIEELKKEMK